MYIFYKLLKILSKNSENIHTLQSFTSSSLPLVQSLYPLQTTEFEMHRPVVHLNGLSGSHRPTCSKMYHVLFNNLKLT